MALNEEDMVTAMEQRLEETFDGEPLKPEDVVVVDDADGDATQEADTDDNAGEPTPDPDKGAAEEPVKESGTTPPEVKEPEEKDTGEPGLSDSLYRAAVHQGWTPDKIKAFYAADKETATQTFQQIYDSTNKLTAEFARLGRAKVTEPVKAEVPAAPVTPDSLAQLKEQYGADDPLIQTIEALQKQMSTLSVPAPKVESAVPEDVALKQVITGFFNDSEMALYKEFYGVATDDGVLTEGAFKNRMAVLNLADQILLGAQQVGRKMEVPEALALAHLTVSEPIREKVIRADIKSKLVKRSKAISLSTGTTVTAAKDGPTTAEELEAKVSERLAKLYPH